MSNVEIALEVQPGEEQPGEEQPGRNLAAWIRPAATFALSAALLAGAVGAPGVTADALVGTVHTLGGGAPDTGCCGSPKQS